VCVQFESLEPRSLLATALTGTISGNVGNGDETYTVDIIRHGSNPPATIDANPNQQTWIVIHGRSSSRFSAPTPNIPRLANAILARRPTDQVLTLDWSGPATAQSGFLFLEEDWIQPVATWAASALSAYGFSASMINLVGHSWGANLSDELAERLGGVNTIIALDPAKDGGGAYNPNANFGSPTAEIDFAPHSQFSWSFYSRDGGVIGITAGNEVTATSADEAFVVTSSEHSRLVNLFSFMLENPTLPVPRFFKLSRLLNHQPGPWFPNRYDFRAAAGNTYEAALSSQAGGESPSSLAWIRSDFTPPTVLASSFEYQTRPRFLRFRLSEDVFDTLGIVDVSIRNNITGAAFNPISLRYDASTNTALFELPAQLADARYTATLGRTFVQDLATNTLDTDHKLDFHILTGDLNYDGQVGIADFLALSSHFNDNNATWSDGDINGDSSVTIADFLALSANFGRSLTDLAAPMGASSATTTSATPKKTKRRHHHRASFLTRSISQRQSAKLRSISSFTSGLQN
jgi:pimeloyl-ACP methyl ester carboxylesterase